jgi:peptide/nickel transport system substrate-binding protein
MTFAQHKEKERGAPMRRMTWLIGAAALAGTIVSSAQAGSPSPSQLATADHRGGKMRLVANAAGGTLDPQINYTLQYWQLYQSMYDGLVTFKHAKGSEGFIIVPDLAEEMPQAQDGGKTYVFKLRKGIKFSNGQDLTVKDVVASFQRIFKVSSPTSGTFYNGIVGADACLKTADTCTLEGGVVGDEAANTVTIHLVAPDSEIFDKLAVPHAVILPASTPTKDQGSTPIPGTGAYMAAAYDSNKQLKLVRNPYFKEWSKDAQPDGYPDEIDMDFGLTEEAEVTAVENGQADWIFDQPPADRLGELGSKYKDQLFINTLTAMYYMPMNTNLPPFNNVKARQAVAYAIDRKATVKLFGGPKLAAPACQILPPGFPGYEPYCPFTKNPGGKWTAPDLVKAKQLVKESGTAGQKVTIVVEDLAPNRAIGVYMQSLLKSLGYVADVKVMSSNLQFTYIQNTKNKVQMSLTEWYQDYPAASDFLNVLFGCDSFHPESDSSVNIAGYCDKEIDAKMKDAQATGITDDAAANKKWAEIDRAVTDAAPAAILFTPKHVDFISKRVGNFQFNGQYYWVITQSWVQ